MAPMVYASPDKTAGRTKSHPYRLHRTLAVMTLPQPKSRKNAIPAGPGVSSQKKIRQMIPPMATHQISSSAAHREIPANRMA